jgi:hypothetical protein
VLAFALSFDSVGRANEVRAVLEAEGYGVELQQQADGSIVVLATPETTEASPEASMARIRALAATLGGEVLGCGGFTSLGIG